MLLCIQPIFKIVTARACSLHFVRFVSFLQKLFADGGYQGRSFKRLQPKSCRICKSKSSNAPIGKRFELLPRRWVVERTFAWLNRCRRLAKDFENLARNALAFLHLASIRLMLRKLCLS